MTTDIESAFDGSETEYPKMAWSYDSGDGWLEIHHNGKLASPRIATQFPTRQGTLVSSEADRLKADGLQVSDHGARKWSAQLFSGAELVADLEFSRVK